jgi:hypothetical protein
LNEGGAEAEQERPFLIEELRSGDGGGFLRAIEAEPPFVLTLNQVTGREKRQSVAEGAVGIPGERIQLVDRERKVGIGAQEGGDFRGTGFLDVYPGSAKRRVDGLQTAFRLFPAEGGLGRGPVGNCDQG